VNTRRQSLLILAAIAVLFTLIWTGVSPAQERPSSIPNTTIKVDVDLVLVTATVSDSEGRTVTGLEQGNFQVWEDKVEQKIEYFFGEDAPVSIGLIFDATGSMADKITRARDAALTFLKTGNPEDDYFLITFSERPRFIESFTSDISRLQNDMLFTGPKGLTPLFDAVYLGLEKMKSANHKRKALLLITDGEDNHSRYSFSEVKQFAREQDVQLFAIGILGPPGELTEGQPGRTTIEELVETASGEAFFPESADELADICTKIALELRNQYVLGYRSTNPAREGRWRKVRLKVNPPTGATKLSVRSRGGYYAENLNPKP
jgi:Ca-activated chloride channel family protein